MAMQESNGELSGELIQEAHTEVSNYLSLAKHCIDDGADYEQAVGFYELAFEIFQNRKEEISVNISEAWRKALNCMRPCDFFQVSEETRRRFITVLRDIEQKSKMDTAIINSARSIADILQNMPKNSTAEIKTEKNKDESKQESKQESLLLGPNVTKEEIDAEIQLFLSTVSSKYIKAMRNCAGHQENPLWGGDVELIEIAKILQVQIEIHKNQIGNIQPLFGDKNSQQKIHLLLIGENYGGGHYCLLIPNEQKPNEQNSFDQRGITPDGDCLFNACLAGKRQLDNAIEEFRQSTSEEIRELRNKVCDNLEVLLENIKDGKPRKDGEKIFNYTDHDDPIKARFTAIIHGEAQDLSNHINDLPHSDLRDEAKVLRELRYPPVVKALVLEASDSKIFAGFSWGTKTTDSMNDFDFVWEKKSPVSNKREYPFFDSSNVEKRAVRKKLDFGLNYSDSNELNDLAERYINEVDLAMPGIEGIFGGSSNFNRNTRK